MSNAFVSRLETYYDLRKFDGASKKLANANGLHGVDSMLWDSSDHPLELGAAGVNAIAHALTSIFGSRSFCCGGSHSGIWARVQFILV